MYTFLSSSSLILTKFSDKIARFPSKVICQAIETIKMSLSQSETMSMSSFKRSLLAVRPFCSPMTLDVPPPAPQTTMLAKMSAKQVERQGKKNEQKVMKEREKALKREEKRGQKERKGKKDKNNKEEKTARKVLWILIENL